MAKSSHSSDKTNVTRIKASDSSSPKKSKTAKQAPRTSSEGTKLSDITNEKQTGKTKRRSPLRAFGGYFKGSWYELRQVRWPDRRTTWSMTGALLAFTTFFVVVIVLLDAGFQKLFNALIGS